MSGKRCTRLIQKPHRGRDGLHVGQAGEGDMQAQEIGRNHAARGPQAGSGSGPCMALRPVTAFSSGAFIIWRKGRIRSAALAEFATIARRIVLLR
jgi:hypothetical protein